MQGLTKAILGSQRVFLYADTVFSPLREQVRHASVVTAVLSGVDVRLMLSEYADNRITHI